MKTAPNKLKAVGEGNTLERVIHLSTIFRFSLQIFPYGWDGFWSRLTPVILRDKRMSQSEILKEISDPFSYFDWEFF